MIQNFTAADVPDQSGKTFFVTGANTGIGFEAAQIVARIATPATEQAWVDRASRRTFKHLRDPSQGVVLGLQLLDEEQAD